ncbi:RnfABCDGE type electron transport complex subunit D [Pseudothermotoga thermarum]|uniref:Ion-translocating oxidoreductase complex subunit D n=1 Tax=Pseudothermotoga thermarum DSM 5069 TaxID=688269 RepID=F7YUF0_9THEM|nr:RnfABCDGE type electron transport complex subunit D [Pseudothermotoga thermarum]AEH51351.1 electron transport complex, RnfABCDGE type, D subunit [Pseudothermotoga thermarum DSM 5069]
MNLVVKDAPHLRTDDSVRKIMADVLIALAPAVAAGALFFGWYALVLCIFGALIAELIELFIVKVLRKQKDFTPDLSAAVTGLLLAMNLPPTAPWWLLLIGIVVAIGVAKQAFGGIGQNIFNPALVGRVFLLISFPTLMTRWINPVSSFKAFAPDALTSATALGVLKQQGFSQVIAKFSYLDLFLGNVGGCIGETSALMLLIGFAYLVFRKRIKIMIPVTYIGTVFVFSSITYFVNPERFGTPLLHILAGGLMLGALFMATDMVTTPMTLKGQAVFGLGCGIVTMVIRFFAGYPEGVSLAILLMNAITPLIDRVFKPKIFGEVRA